MDQALRTLQLGTENFLGHQEPPNRHVGYCCHFCSKPYTSSTWLDKHIKEKHSAESAFGRLQSLTDTIHNPRGIENRTILLPQSSIPQEFHHSNLVRDLQAMSSSLKRFIPLLDDLVALLQEPNDVSSRARSINQNHARNLKRRASSRVLHEQTKRRGASTSNSNLPFLRTNDPIRWGNLDSQDASSATNLGEGDLYGFDGSEHALDTAHHPSFEQVQEVRLPFSQQTTLSAQAPAGESPRQQRKSSASRAPKTQSLTGNANHMFQTFPRQKRGHLSPREQLTSYPHGTSQARLATEWVLPESTGHMTRTPFQKSLDLPSHEQGQHPSPSKALQQSSDYLGPASQYDIGDAFGQTPQQNGFENGLGLDQSKFFTLPMQPEEALGEEGRRNPWGSSFP